MATITPTIAVLEGDDNVKTASYAALTTTNDVGSAFTKVQWADRSIQVTGTFGAGGSLRWEGSNDGTNYYALTNPQGDALNITAAKVDAITEITAYARPRVTAGDGTTSLTVTLIALKSAARRGG